MNTSIHDEKLFFTTEWIMRIPQPYARFRLFVLHLWWPPILPLWHCQQKFARKGEVWWCLIFQIKYCLTFSDNKDSNCKMTKRRAVDRIIQRSYLPGSSDIWVDCKRRLKLYQTNVALHTCFVPVRMNFNILILVVMHIFISLEW